ncbi:MAG: hypothetical protein KC731_21820 [Myxococcales bacterium]|nr:hypothetical protein [Myxococcales bacterium]
MSSRGATTMAALALVGACHIVSGLDGLEGQPPPGEGGARASTTTAGGGEVMGDGGMGGDTPQGGAAPAPCDAGGGGGPDACRGDVIWSRALSASWGVAVQAVAVAPDGGIYVAGRASGSGDFGLGPFSAGSSSDGFVVKYGPDGTLAWQRWVTGASYGARVTALAASETGVVVGGWSNDDYVAGGIPHQNDHYGYADGFVESLDADGNLSWHTRIRGMNDQEVTSVAISQSGAVAVTGTYYDDLVIDDVVDVEDRSSYDAFVALLDEDGHLAWVHRYGDLGMYQWGGDVAFSPGGERLYATGDFWGTVTIAGQTLSAAGRSGYVAALDPTGGSEVWARQLDGPGYEYLFGIVATASELWLAGTFQGGASLAGGKVLDGSGNDDVLVGRLDGAGDHLSSWGLDNTHGLTSYRRLLDVDRHGRVVVVGAFDAQLVVGDTTLAPNDYDDAFVIKYDEDGSPIWAQAFGAPPGLYGNEAALEVAIDPADASIVVVGQFDESLTFEQTHNATPSYESAFIVKLTP